MIKGCELLSFFLFSFFFFFNRKRVRTELEFQPLPSRFVNVGLGSQTRPKHPWMLSIPRPPSCQQKRATEKPVKQVGEQAPDIIYYF